MTFEAYEASARGGKPTHLFVFTRQSLVWRFAATDRDITIGGKTYLAAPISRSNIRQTLEKPQQNITITMPYALDASTTPLPVTQPIGDIWHPYIPSDVVSVMCLATHLADPDQEVRVQWIGEVQQPKYDVGQLELTCVPPGQISKALYQGEKWSRTCQKSLYSTGIRGCNLVPGAIPVVGTVTAISGSDVMAAAWTPQQRTFAGSTATWTADVDTPRSGTVTAIAGNDVTLDDVTDIEVSTVLTWNGGTGTVTAVADTTLTLDAVTGLAVDDVVTWTGSEPHSYTANITAYDAASTTITLDDVTGIAVGTVVMAHTIELQTHATLTAVDGFAVTAAAFASASLSLAGGYLIWTRADGIVERRSIMAHAGDTITLLYGAADIEVGLDVTALPGCEHTWAACTARGNTDNHGGALFMPVQNPYDGESMSWA